MTAWRRNFWSLLLLVVAFYLVGLFWDTELRFFYEAFG